MYLCVRGYQTMKESPCICVLGVHETESGHVFVC